MKIGLNKWFKKDLNSDDQAGSRKYFEFLQQLQHKYLGLSHKSKWVISGLSILLLLLIIFLINNQNNNIVTLTFDNNKQTHAILNQLDDINVQLEQLSASPQNSNSFRTALYNISDDLSVIKKSVNDLAKASDVQKVSQQIISMQGDVDDQMLDLKRSLATSSDAKQFIDPKVLPFHVISIDVISQQPFVSVDYAHHITPFTVGDSVAGWKLTSADYAAGEVEFKNKRDQYVKIALQG